MKKILLSFSCILLVVLCGFAKIDLASSSKSYSKSEGVKKGDIKITQDIDAYIGNTWYVISDAIFQDNDIRYLCKNHKTTNVTVYDEDFHVIGTIKNAVTKQYVQVLNNGQPFEVGLLSKRKSKSDVNFFGWYQEGSDSWILPCQYANIERFNDSILLATTLKNQSKETVQIYNIDNDIALKTSMATDQLKELFFSCGRYYWIYNGKNTYEVYSKKLEWIRTVKYHDDQIYYDDGKVRVSKEQVLTSLGVNAPKEACLTMEALCWPKYDKTLLCNIALNKDFGYQETDDYIIDQNYKEIYHQNIAGAGITRYQDYYLCFSDGNFTDRKVFNKDGKQVISKNGVQANGMVSHEEGSNLYGYQDGMMYIFTPSGDDVVSFPMEDRNAFFQQIVGQCSNVVVVFDETTEQLNVYYQDELIYSVTFPNEIPVVDMCKRKNGDVIIHMNHRLLYITDQGEIYLNQIINKTKDGKMVTVFNDGYVTCCKGKKRVTKLSNIREDKVNIQGEYGTKDEPTYYVLSDWAIEYNDFVGNQVKTSNVTILDENHHVIKTIKNALAKEYYQVIHGDSPIEIGLLSERKNDDMNIFGWYQPDQDQWLLPCKYESIYGDDHEIELITADHSTHPRTQTIQTISRKNNKCIQTYGRFYDNLVDKYGDYYWFYDNQNEIQIYDEDLNFVRYLKPEDDKLYYEDGTVRTTKRDLLVALKVEDLEKNKKTMSGLCWPSNEKNFVCSINEGEYDIDCYECVINTDNQMFCLSNEHIGGVYQTGDYYEPASEMIEYGEVYDSFGNLVKGNNGKTIHGIYETEDGYHFYGCDGGTMYVFNENRDQIGSFPFSDEDARIYGPYGDIIGAKIYGAGDSIVIYHKDQLTYEYDLEEHYEENGGYARFCMNQIQSGDVVASVGADLMYISQDGTIKSQQKVEGQVLELYKDFYIVRYDGKTKLCEYDKEILKDNAQ